MYWMFFTNLNKRVIPNDYEQLMENTVCNFIENETVPQTIWRGLLFFNLFLRFTFLITKTRKHFILHNYLKGSLEFRIFCLHCVYTHASRSWGVFTVTTVNYVSNCGRGGWFKGNHVRTNNLIQVNNQQHHHHWARQPLVEINQYFLNPHKISLFKT